ncbi:hypothetical protein L210DRAFT_933190 [Boletus edulis BED1]|uniref:C2H2-type domain-containing protein n=1 Tax=Boletus edulis BED1 TaxID=1328754 RepID=A0AAD4BHG4_BOLED|nr:hypothetical protein L210DRAFT_933190 [Boletus edulis BED1]
MAKPRAAPVNCPTCGKTISRKCDLPRHMKIHMPDKEEQKLPCPYQGCPFRAFQKSGLNTHLNVQGANFVRETRVPSVDIARTCTRISQDEDLGVIVPLLLGRPHVDGEGLEGSKNTSPAYGTELTIKSVQVNDTPLAFPENVYLVPYGSRVLIAPETPVADHAQLLVPDQGGLSTFGFDSVAPRASHIAVDDGSFDGLRAGFNNWLPGPIPVYTGPSFPMPADRYTTDASTHPYLHRCSHPSPYLQLTRSTIHLHTFSHPSSLVHTK